MNRLGITRCGKTEFRWGERTYVMGIINLSPDSFSADGITDPEVALAQAQRFVSQGADILDTGGEPPVITRSWIPRPCTQIHSTFSGRIRNDITNRNRIVP